MRVSGGPFEACPAEAAFSVCLESRAANAAQASVLLPTRDFGLPDAAALRAAVAAALTAMRAAPVGEVFVGCRAGLGRTGTFLACLAVAAGAVPEGEDPVQWLRARYDARAVETPEQMAMVRGFRPG
ncbi:MAG: hypothetical protein K2X11_07260 [Acetobacteraceae bacterium]|nr:hypothetical protein [Acetobacteraceae bacterium]